MIDVLEDLKKELKILLDDNIKSVKIGLEASITANNCPMIRIVPSLLIDNSVYKTLEFTIFIGVNKSNIDLESNYKQLSELSDLICDKFVSTEFNGGLLSLKAIVFDEDRLDNLKMMGLNFKLSNF